MSATLVTEAATNTETTPRGGAPPATTSVVRNAAALMLSTVASAAMGFLFWVVAARWFPPEVVGRASAVIAAMTLLASISQLNLVSLYARFLPHAGAHTRRWVVGGFAASVVMAAILSTGFLALGLGGGLLGGGAGWVLFFGVSVALSGLYFIVDGVLTPLGKASWVPVKNVGAAAVKLGLLAALAATGITASASGVLLAWMIPVAAAVLFAGAVIVGRMVHGRRTPAGAEPVDSREVTRFVSAEYVNGVLTNVVAFVPPVLVTHALGATDGAFFYLPWIIGVAATTMLWNVVTSFVVAATSDPGGARHHLTRAIRLGLLVVVPGAIVMITAATPLLSIVGTDYAAHGAMALRLIGASLPFTAVLLLYGAFCVMRKRMWALAAVQAGSVAVLMVGSLLGVGALGATAPALAYLVAQATFGLLVLPAVIRRYRETVQQRAAWAKTPALAESGA